MLDHLIFNKLKWWSSNADQQALILPIMVQVKDPYIGANIHVDVMDDRYSGYSQQSGTYKVLGQTEDGSYIIRYKVSWVPGNGMIATVAQKDCTPISQNGGVLRRLYTKLRGTFRKAVVLC